MHIRLDHLSGHEDFPVCYFNYRISHVGTAVGFEPLRSQTNAWKFQDYKCLSGTPVDSSKLPLHLHQHKHAAFRTTTDLPVDFNHYLSLLSHICLSSDRASVNQIIPLKVTGALPRGWWVTEPLV